MEKNLPVTSARTSLGQKCLKMNTEGNFSWNLLLAYTCCSLSLQPSMVFRHRHHGAGGHPCWPLHSFRQNGCSATAQLMQRELMLPPATTLPKLCL